MPTVQGRSSGITAADRGPATGSATGPGTGSATRPGTGGTALTDAELTALALAADPDAPLAADAVPIGQVLGGHDGLLPDWYMPTPMAHGTSRTRVALIALVILASLVIPAAGLCITYGTLTLA